MSMRITDNHSILEYQKNNLINNQNMHNLLKITKEIVLDNKLFKNYKESHMNLTQEMTFKLPEIENYPLMKNEDIVAMSSRVSRNETIVKSAKIDKGKIDLLNLTTNSKENLFKSRANKNTEKIYHQKDFFDYDGNNDKHLYDRNNTHKSIFDFNMIHDPELNIKQFNIEKQIFNKYNSSEYFNVIKKYLIARIEEIINGKNENITTTKSKTFTASYKNSDYEIKLKCQSLYIEFIPKEGSEKISPFSFNLPFSILPIFYYADNYTFKLFLSKILKFDIGFKHISIDLENFRENMKDLSNIILNNNNVHDDSILLNKIKKGNFHIDWITPNVIYEMSIQPPSLEFEIRNVDEAHINYGYIDTKGNETNDYYLIRKTIDKELMIYILQNNFVEWDFYLINYIVRFKNFRTLVKDYLNVVRKNKNKKIQFNNPMRFDMDKLDIENNFDLQNSSDIISTRNLNIKNNSINKNFHKNNHIANTNNDNNKNSLSYSNSYKSTLNSYEFMVSFLKKDKTITKNSYQIICPHRIQVILEPLGYPKQEYSFSLNFSQMICLELIKKLPLTQLEYFIKMIVNIDYHKKVVKMNYKSLDSIKDIILRRIKLGTNIFDNYNNLNVFEDSVANCNSQIIINAPVITLAKSNEKSFMKIHRLISQELLSKLNSCEINDWPQVLLENFEELINEEVLEEEKIRKRAFTTTSNYEDKTKKIMRSTTMRLNMNLIEKK